MLICLFFGGGKFGGVDCVGLWWFFGWWSCLGVGKFCLLFLNEDGFFGDFVNIIF